MPGSGVSPMPKLKRDFEKIISVIKTIAVCVVMVVAICMQGDAGLIFSGLVLTGAWLIKIVG